MKILQKSIKRHFFKDINNFINLKLKFNSINKYNKKLNIYNKYK